MDAFLRFVPTGSDNGAYAASQLSGFADLPVDVNSSHDGGLTSIPEY
jgi:hypothetical protein